MRHLDARNPTACGSPQWVIRVGLVICAACPIYTQHRTFPDLVGTSQLGQFPTSARAN